MGFLHEHIILPLSDLLRGEQVHKYLRLLREAEQWSPEQMHAFQQQRLRQLLTTVVKEVPFYRDWFLDKRLDLADIQLKQLPIVSKHIMRQEGIDRFTNRAFPSKDRLTSRSSGSTGEPFTFYETPESYSVNMAVKLHSWFEAGYRMGDRYMKIANSNRKSKLKQLQDSVNRCTYIPFYSMNEETVRQVLDNTERSKPLFIRSYPAPLYLLAKYRNSHPGYRFSPRHIMTTGSTLTQEYREEIERAFGCDIIDSYSCEGTPDVYETTAHDGYKVADYYGIIEVLDKDNRHVTDGVGRVVSTDLWNLAHPFLRYDTQDLVEIRNGRIIRIMGRECDTITSSNGTIYTNHNFSFFFTHKIVGIDTYQIVRHSDNSITLKIVVNKAYTAESKQQIVYYWQHLLSVPVNVDVVDAIPLMGNNKRRTIVYEQ